MLVVSQTGVCLRAERPGHLANDPKRDNHWLTWIHVQESAFGEGSLAEDGRHRIVSVTSGNKVSQVALGERVIVLLLASRVPLAIPAPAMVGETGEVVRTLSSWQQLVRVRGVEYVANIKSVVRRDEHGKICIVTSAAGEHVIVRDICGTVVYCERQ